MKQLGQILTPKDGVPHGVRDAFHAPCILVTSPRIMFAGSEVKFLDENFNTVDLFIHGKEQKQAVVDPFLPRPAHPGELFWVLLVPNATSNLRHHYDVNLK